MSMIRKQLLLRALAALCEVADECPSRPAPRSLSLRFILAYTFAAAGADPETKWIWDSFWAHVTTAPDPMRPKDDYLRGTGARTALSGICRQVGYPPDNAFLDMLRERRVRRSPTGAGVESPLHPNEGAGDDSAA